MPCRLLCVGDLNADVTVSVEGGISVGSDTPGTVVMSGGGSAANVAAWAAEAGSAARFVGVVGSDPLGSFLIDDLAGHGVEVYVTRRHDAATRAIAAIVEADGNRSMVSALDPATVLASDDIASSWFDDVDWVHLTAYTYLQPAGRETFAQLVATIESLSIPWSVDPSSAQMLASRCRREDVATAFDGASILFPNTDEASWLADAEDPVVAAERLLDVSETVVVTCGADGAVIARRGLPTFRIPAAPTDLVNTLGCGDAFAGGFLSGRLHGHDDLASAGMAADVAVRAARSAGSR
ncbi:carbohydrate kinase family protein [bacterium]|nr:carbohydrate kinase family protein [bacterium]